MTPRRPKSFRLVSSERVLQSRVFTVERETWESPAGQRFTRDDVVHPGAVGILPFVTAERVLLLRQFRAAVRDWHLEIPAGTLEAGETPLACAKRELVEETGHAARRWRKLGTCYTAPGFCTELMHLYAASDLRPATAPADDDEHIEVVELTLDEVRDLARRGKLRDAKTHSALWLHGLAR